MWPVAMLAVAGAISPAPAEQIDVEFVLVPADSAQPNGPPHDFRIGRFEITNEQFVRFLNDAQQNLSSPRGHYMYFDTSNGDVYVHSAMVGGSGATPPSGFTVKMFSPSVSGQIIRVGGQYEVVQEPIDYSTHPVTGVSWYGAVKYCNWLTLEAGLDPTQRAYAESTAGNLAGWRPVTISTPAWAVRDLNDAERAALLQVAGFRLPMDGGPGSTNPGRYNEWFKTAAWDESAGVNRLYGFGRDAITIADANYRCSLDPFENAQDCLLGGTTPTGFYNGTDHDGVFATGLNANSFGAFDLSGNVWEWMQDQSTSPSDRRNRGGSHRSAAVSLQVGLSAERPAGSVNDSTGFRVVQSIPSPFLVSSPAQMNLTGPWGGPLSPAEGATYCVSNLTDGVIQYAVYTQAPWITLDGVVQGTLAPLSTLIISAHVEFDCTNALPVGSHTATILFEDLTNQIIVTRNLQLTLTEPLSLSPNTNMTATMAYAGTPTPASAQYVLTSQSEGAVEWSANWVETSGTPSGVNWISLTPTGGIVLPADPPVSFTVMLQPELLPPGTHSASVVWRNHCTNSTFMRTVTLSIVPPLSVNQAPMASSAVCDGPFQPAAHVLTLTNPHTMPVTFEASVPQAYADLVELTPASGTIAAGANLGVSVQILGTGGSVMDSPLTVPITVSHPATGFHVTRHLMLTVEQLMVEPVAGFTMEGPLGGPFEPPYVLRIHHYGFNELTWSITFEETTNPPSGVNWLAISPPIGTILNPGGVGHAELDITYEAKSLPAGLYTGQLIVTADSCMTTRTVTLLVGEESFRIPMSGLLPLPQQPGGPAYFYRVGRFEVTNREFARFLNDALRNADNARGAFLSHHPGDRRLTLMGDGTLLFDGSLTNDLLWINGRYQVMSGREDFPVAGVTWFGALKFCNWLTLVHGMDSPDQRAYHEGPNRLDWYPITTNSIIYGNLDLTPAQRNQLVTSVRGYRLPMDGASTEAAPYNEWYKAAAWRPGTGTHTTYGFGRNSLTGKDANFKDSCDPFELSGRSPVGFFDGQSLLQGNCGVTAANGNPFGIYDLTGNVSEWMQDFGTSPADRATRGGHFENLQSSPNLTNSVRVPRPPDQALATTGFRLAQALSPAPPLVSVDAVRLSGPVGGPFDRDGFALTVGNSADYALDGVSVTSSAGWLSAAGPGIPVIPPGHEQVVTIRASMNPAQLGVSPSPGAEFTLIPARDVQPGGPIHDFWMGQTEVTNAEYAGFLNNARANALSSNPDARSHHMYFDLDSGSVYINDKQAGEEGIAAPGPFLFFLLYDAQKGRIRFNGQSFVPEAGYENHPVVGVSWYGAVKYCNWLTIAAGLPASLRAYIEDASPLLSNWRPAVMDDIEWIRNGVNDSHRAAVIESTLGYRLPMDGGAEDAALYNEWYKAAAWNPNDEGAYRYGFGRDEISSLDANYSEATHPTWESTAPVRFYNGSNTLPYESAICPALADIPPRARASANAYALFDLTGNVAEWTQELGPTFADRIVRGGSWRDSGDSEYLTTSGRRGLAGHHAYDDVGFRVVRGAGRHVHIQVQDEVSSSATSLALIVDASEPLRVEPRPIIEREILLGQAPAEPWPAYVITNESLAPMSVQISSNASWAVLSSAALPTLTGALAAQGVLSVNLNVSVGGLAPGTHEAAITVANLTTGQNTVRRIRVKVIDPVEVVRLSPDPQQFEGTWRDEFISPLAVRSFRITNLQAQTLSFVATGSAPWISPGPPGALSGLLLPNESRTLTAHMANGAADLGVGRYSGSLNLQLSTVGAPTISWVRSEPVTLVVHDPLGVSPSDEVWEVGPHLSASNLPNRVFTLVNNHDAPIEVSASTDVAWLSLNQNQWELAPGQQVEVMANITSQALLLHHGDYPGRITFQTLTTGASQCRPVNLHVVERLAVDPFADYLAAGTPGGVIDPLGKTYSLSNLSPQDEGVLAWTATVEPASATWLLINGGPIASGVLAGGQQASLLLSIHPQAAALLSEGTHEAEVRIRNQTDDESVVRMARLTLSVPAFAHAEKPVSHAVVQPSGPTYPFRMSRFHTTNAEFVAFLNDAMMNPTNERGQYMYFDLDTGNVYVNTIMNGEFGHGAAGRTTRMFTCNANGPILFNGDVYSVSSIPVNAAVHPVTGVSWYGAVKYANWLTIDQGMLPSQRCCLEDVQSNLAGWRPVTISGPNWLVRDLNDAERSALVQNYRGFRLPMDDGHNNASPALDSADDYNEWYKAAAWNITLNQNSLYGFGRNLLTPGDANYLNSGDPFDNGTTPVGFYGGPNQMPSYSTNANHNAFDLFDMTGNVYQWILGRYNSNANSIAFRTLRGGSYGDAAGSTALRTNSRTFTTPSLTDPLVGFRVVRTPAPANGDLNGDGHSGLADFAMALTCFAGPAPVNPLTCAAFDFDSDDDFDLRDLRQYQIQFTPPAP